MSIDPVPVKYCRLRQTHPDLDLGYLAEIRALYRGGRALLHNREVLRRVFPQHIGEEDQVYEERCKRAFYVGHMSTIVDHIVAGLATDPIKMDVPKGADDYYRALADDVSAPGGRRMTLASMLKNTATDALLLERAWTLVDLPQEAPNPPASELEQRQSQSIDPYFVPVPTECVIDWRADDDGSLAWVMVHTTTRTRESISDDRSLVVEEYTAYGPENWVTWRVAYDAEGHGERKRPADDDMIAPWAAGAHSFGRVPLVEMRVPSGLWAGDKLESLAREHMNKICALSWAEIKSLFQQLYEFLAPEMGGDAMTLNEHQADVHRAVRQKRGPGRVQTRGDQDKAMYIGPSTDSFTHALESTKRIAESMYRVLFQMALAEDNSGAVIRRSADSKKLDHTATNVVLQSLGELLRLHAEALYELAACGRGDVDAAGCSMVAANAGGYKHFDPAAVADSIEEALGVDTLSLPSPTFQRLYKFNLAKQLLGEAATEADLSAIRREIEANISAEEMEPVARGVAVDEPEDDDTDEEQDDEQAA